MIITIDGPAGSGKSTVARELSGILKIPCIETGAMFRGVAWYCKHLSIDFTNEKKIVKGLRSGELEFVTEKDRMEVRFRGRSIDDALYTPEMSELASKIAQLPAVRELLKRLQQRLAELGSCIFEGRDMGTEVFPEADHKFFLVTTPEERARRRWLQLEGTGKRVSYEEVLSAILSRDHQDENRPMAPLKPAPDAKIIDTTHLSVSEVVDMILGFIGERS